MARRRDYVSFFSDGRGRSREFAAFGRRHSAMRLLLPALTMAVLAVAVWWYVVRDDPAAEITLEDIEVPAVLFPADDDGSVGGDEPAVRCVDEADEWSTFQGTATRTGCTSARTISTPRIVWQVDVGVQGWLNNPLVVGDLVFVGSAGHAQNQRDNADGVYAFRLATGERAWFFGAELDVNGVGFSQNAVIATGDEGKVWALAASNGTLIWSHDLEVATFGNPLTVGDIVVVGDDAGRVTAFNVRTGEVVWQHRLSGPIRGGAASDGRIIVVNSETREVLAVTPQGAELWRVTVRASDPQSDQGRLWAAPTIVGDRVILGLLRTSTFVEPALLALDAEDGSIAWEARDAAGISAEWANVRSSPAAVDGMLLYGQPYSRHLVAVDTQLGETLWAAELAAPGREDGLYCFQHWPSPAIVGDQVVVPRQDGGLYAVSLTTHRVVWSIYLGTAESGGQFPEEFGDGFCDPLPEGHGAIQASPAVAPDGTVVIGTLDGRLVAVGDRDW
jgi:outer membrane protein assembly factor BamB